MEHRSLRKAKADAGDILHDGEISSRELGHRALITRLGIRPPFYPGPKAITLEPKKSQPEISISPCSIGGASAIHLDFSGLTIDNLSCSRP